MPVEPLPRTLWDRCQALHDRMDALLAKHRAERATHYVQADARVWITDGWNNRMISRSDPVPQGWTHGVTKARSSRR